jgi:pilus assembly protein CpaB
MIKVEEIVGYNISNIITNKSDAVGKYASADLLSGDLILESKVSNSITDSNDSLSTLDGSKSAISVTIKTFADGLSDKLSMGDIVTCIVTDSNSKKTTTPTELTYLKVLAVTQKNGTDKQSDIKSESNHENMATVTVLANPKQAELLANYDTTSDVHFALVYRGDVNIAKQFIAKQDGVFNK